MEEEYNEILQRLESLGPVIEEQAKEVYSYRMNYHKAYYDYETYSFLALNVDPAYKPKMKEYSDTYDEARTIKINAEIELDRLKTLVKDLKDKSDKLVIQMSRNYKKRAGF